jgi:hypothetical protein
MISLDLSPSPKTLRQFSWIALPGFGLIGALFFWKWDLPWVAYPIWGLAILTPLLDLLHPRAVLPIFIALTLLGFPIGLVVSNVVTALIFFGLFTPIGLFFRLIRRDSLKRRIDPEAASYWEPAPPERPASDYLRQY